ncbi:unnamed protein product, partial [Cyprideis torosa]
AVAVVAWVGAGNTTAMVFYPLAFFGLGVAHSGVRLGRKTYLVDMSEGNRRTDYVAVSNTTIGALLLLSGALGALTSLVSVPGTLLLLGLGGCASFDVVHILKKARQDVTDCDATIEAERAETEPKVFTKIHIHFKVSGKGLSAKHVERAISMSAEKYCSASIMLGKTAELSHSHEVIDES